MMLNLRGNVHLFLLCSLLSIGFVSGLTDTGFAAPTQHVDRGSSQTNSLTCYNIAKVTHDEIRAKTLAGAMEYNNKKKNNTIIGESDKVTDCSGYVSFVLYRYFEKAGIKDIMPEKQLKSWDFANIARVINKEEFLTEGRKSTTPKSTIDTLSNYFTTVDFETSGTNSYNIKKYATQGDVLVYLTYEPEKKRHSGHVEIYTGTVFTSGENAGEPKVLSCGSTSQMKNQANLYGRKRPLKYILRLRDDLPRK
jgi:hypothetical protein